MEKRQLDFNAPLMSTRRYSSPSKSSELVKWKAVEKPLPCRQQSLQPNKSDWESEVTKPVAVPFHWEKIPGRPKGEVEESNTPRLPPARLSDAIRRSSGEIPKLPPGRVSGPSRYCSGERSNDQSVAFGFNDHASLLEKLNESLNCRDDSDSESGEDAYSDALDTLSLAESWSFNYSVSGISGCQSSGVKPSGTFCIDTQTRDFMMNRFLPAAKAAVLDTPEYAVKKPSLLKEKPPKQVKKAVSGEMKPPLRQYSSDALPYYTHEYINNVESEDEDQETVAPKKKSGKTWGILPRFCVKNSLCLLNPLPALKLKPKSRAPSPSTPEVRRMSRNAHSGPLDKNACQVVQKKKFHSGLLSRDLPGIDNKFANDSCQFMNSSDSHRSTGVSPLRRYRSGNISPYRNESPKSPFREGAGFLGVPKEVETFNSKIASSRKLFKALHDVSRNQINEKAASGPIPTADPVEKTVYVDYVKKKDLPTKAEQVVDAAKANTLEEGKKVFGPTAKPGYVADAMEGVISNQSLCQESMNEVPSEAKLVVKLESDKGRELDPPVKSPLPPPLPKSPTESWLWRTLPSISLGNPFAISRRSNSSPLHQKKQGQKVSATNTKWETIVKTSNLRHDHVRYSQELVHRASSNRPMKS